MSHEIEIVADGDGIALIGDAGSIEQFLASEGLGSRSLGIERFSRVAGKAGVALQMGGQFAEQSGRWVKLTEQSARLLKHGSLMKGPNLDTARAIITQNGKSAHILQLVMTPTSILTNPAALAGAGGLMAQLSMQHQMDEISDYLAVIDAKLDDVLRQQTDAVLADMMGVDLVLRDAMDARDQVGRVSDVTWSKVQGTSVTIARTQAYALLQIKDLADRVDRAKSMDDLASVSKTVVSPVEDWLAVLAQCFRLQDGVAILELDRVFDASPDELDEHTLAIKISRAKRIGTIGAVTGRLLDRMGASIMTANSKVLLQPFDARSVVESSSRVSKSVGELHDRLGMDERGQALQGRRWTEAVSDARDRVVETGAAGAGAASRVASGGAERLRLASTTISGRLGKFNATRRDASRALDVGEELVAPEPD